LSEPNANKLQSVAIRLAEQSDIVIICRNEGLAYEIPWSDKLLRDCLLGNYVCFIMTFQDKIIGHMIFQQVLDEIHLHNVCVLPDLQNSGLGDRWLDHLETYAREHRIRDIILEVRASNLIAKKLYAKRGYREIGLRKGYYQNQNGREDGLVMKARID
jgi:ribosomal-protein-alanine N-acetyltransferase